MLTPPTSATRHPRRVAHLNSYLVEYLRELTATPGPKVYLYCCWEGDFDEPASKHEQATIEDLAADPDPVPEGTLVELIP